MTASKKSVYDCKHVRSVKAWALMFDGKFHGRIVANYSDNPEGSVVTVGVSVWSGPLNNAEGGPLLGKAGGYGYCKFSAAFDSAVRKHCKNKEIAIPPLAGAGESSVRSFLESLGYQVLQVI